MKLLSNGTTNAKTSKNAIKTFILYFAPYTKNSKGINLCPKASAGCAAACLDTSGMGIFPNVQNARIAKADYYVENKEAFIQQLAKEILTKHRTAVKRGEKIAFRLNGTSDVDFIYLLKKYAGLDISTLSNAVFYDYTKILGKALKYKGHHNYTVTFSRAEDNENDVQKAIENGINVAAVFSGQLPSTWAGVPVIDGDKSDLEMIGKEGVILGLVAKGKAKKDKSNFVIHN